ncbi:MAG: class I SAM-dependent methyltransferase [Solobacterium sp.]|jgi:tRNA (adenine22-N1)-methyltransferase|nr:class I SAM-dependent methyltransferase [Solobacterium sp.]MCH4205242.1 class I SAM-dependent methyltransferase [Solobacterium sp.]MCH4226835.1 class I SAM-dependent methyltransferase [Solobacterium sp.]MCH4281595.1 class I SAM-dependent methyltransferase [Solobacterium sp.]
MANIRLNEIAKMVKKGVRAADIGTDHALLPILLIQKKTCCKVYACDIAPGPLQAAKDNIAKAGLSSCIETILSDGLQNVPSDADACIIAGMGGMNAIEIMNHAGERIAQMKQIIIEANRDTYKVREWISEHQYTIEDEIYINDRHHDYTVISFASKRHDPYSREELILGPVLIKKKDPAYLLYCTKQEKKIEKIIGGIKQLKADGSGSEELQRDLMIYKEYLNN